MPPSNGTTNGLMQTKYLIGFFVLIMVAGMLATVSFGLKPRPIPKIDFSSFKSPDIVAKSLLNSIPQEIAESPVVFWGANPEQPYYTQVLAKFLESTQSLQFKFQAIVIDESFHDLQLPEGLSAEKFSLGHEPVRFSQGLSHVSQQHLHLLVIVPTLEASAHLAGSLLSQTRQQWQSIAPGTVLPIGLVFAPFPRSRAQESSLAIPCNTGDQDLDHVASLGCLILQSSRTLYRKHADPDTWVGQLQQIGTGDFLFLLTPEIAKAN